MKIQKNNHETNDIIKSDAAALTIGQKNISAASEAAKTVHILEPDSVVCGLCDALAGVC